MKSILTPGRLINYLSITVLLLSMITRSGVDPTDQMEQIRAHSRPYEFDFVSWTLSALTKKGSQASLGVDRVMPVSEQRQLVFDYLELKDKTNQLGSQLSSIIADPNQENRQSRESEVREEWEREVARRETLAPFVEQILQSQMNKALVELDLSLGGDSSFLRSSTDQSPILMP